MKEVRLNGVTYAVPIPHPIVDVFEFNHELLGVVVKDVPHAEHKHAMFNVKAIIEEAHELRDQHVKINDDGVIETFTDLVHAPGSEDARWQTVHSVDALIDAAYFAFGGLARAGLTVEQALLCFKAVHDANMTKKRGVKAERGDMGVPDAIKPADFVPPEQVIYRILYGETPAGI